MFKNIRNSKGDKGIVEAGFTLVELLVVIAILGILAVVGVLSFNGLTDSAKTATGKTELTQVQTARRRVRCANGGAPQMARRPRPTASTTWHVRRTRSTTAVKCDLHASTADAARRRRTAAPA